MFHVKQFKFMKGRELPVFVFLMMLLSLFALPQSCKAQEPEVKWLANGYELDWPELHVLVDTVRGTVHVQQYIRGLHFINVKTGLYTTLWEQYQPMKYGTAVTFKYNKNYVIRFGRDTFYTYKLL